MWKFVYNRSDREYIFVFICFFWKIKKENVIIIDIKRAWGMPRYYKFHIRWPPNLTAYSTNNSKKSQLYICLDWEPIYFIHHRPIQFLINGINKPFNKTTSLAFCCFNMYYYIIGIFLFQRIIWGRLWPNNFHICSIYNYTRNN
jgi:hypothetical protein